MTTTEMVTTTYLDTAALEVDRSIARAEALGRLEISGERIHPDSTYGTIERIQQLRLALHGVGRVGNHLDREGQPVGEDVAIVLGPHEQETLIMLLTGKVRVRAELSVPGETVVA